MIPKKLALQLAKTNTYIPPSGTVGRLPLTTFLYSPKALECSDLRVLLLPSWLAWLTVYR